MREILYRKYVLNESINDIAVNGGETRCPHGKHEFEITNEKTHEIKCSCGYVGKAQKDSITPVRVIQMIKKLHKYIKDTEEIRNYCVHYMLEK